MDIVSKFKTLETLALFYVSCMPVTQENIDMVRMLYCQCKGLQWSLDYSVQNLLRGERILRYKAPRNLGNQHNIHWLVMRGASYLRLQQAQPFLQTRPFYQYFWDEVYYLSVARDGPNWPMNQGDMSKMAKRLTRTISMAGLNISEPDIIRILVSRFARRN